VESLFVPYAIALALKELGFNEPCFGYYPNCGAIMQKVCKSTDFKTYTIAPLYSQAFKWFREKYDLRIWIESNSPIKFDYTIATSNKEFLSMIFEDSIFYNTYEEAELECLKKLIEIVKELN
jgi:hypothetical protein